MLREFILREKLEKGEKPEEPMLPVKILSSPCKLARIAKENEQPNIKLTMGLGTPVSPSLYENIKVDSKRL